LKVATLPFILIAHLLATLAKLAKPGGVSAVAAESVALKHQLLVMKRRRHRAPSLTSWDRLVLGGCTLFVVPKHRAQ
jgi:putative transposase